MRYLTTSTTIALACLPAMSMATPLSIGRTLSGFNAVTERDFKSYQAVEGGIFVNGDLTDGQLRTGSSEPGAKSEIHVRGQTKIGTISGQNTRIRLGDADRVGTDFEKTGPGPFKVRISGPYSGEAAPGTVRADQADVLRNAPEVSFDKIARYSTFLSGLSGDSYGGSSFDVMNNAVQSEGRNWDASKVTIYNTSLDDLRAGSFVTDLSARRGETLIVNVAGERGHFGLTPPETGSSVAGQVLWNFHEAEKIKVDTAIMGSVIAPNATMAGFSGVSEGSILARLIRLTQGSLNVNRFTGDLPCPPMNVPEIGAQGATGSLALVFGAIAVMTGHRRRVV